VFNREGIEWEPWDNGVNHKVGQWLLQAFNDTTGWLTRANDRPRGGKKLITRICYSQEFIAHRDTILAAAEELAFCQWPMLCPPIEWTNDHNGGYLTEQIRRVNALIRKAGKVASPKQGDIPLAMLNNLQGQAYKINEAVLDIAEICYANKESVGKFVCHAPMPIPQSPGDDCTEEQLSAYKRARREAEDFNAQLNQKNWRTTEAMYVARKYAKEPRWWCACSFDYRGRIYFQNTALNPQGTDFDKSLVYFADEGPVDEYWLSFHVATTWGLSKDTMADRVKWARENIDLIDRIALDPIRNKEWQDADEPWCFLAACIEYKACVIDSTKHLSGLCLGIDATCSGLQHLSALTRCGATAALVNVTPTDKPADAYKTVAEAAKKHLPKEQQGWINRRTTKRAVMCTPYGVTMSSARGYIRDQLIKDGYKEQLREPGVLNGIVKAIFNEAIPEVIPGPVQVMAWLKRSAGEIIDRGETTITWTSPSGFVVNQHLNKTNTIRVDTRIMGGARVNCQVADGFTNEPDRAHHKSALAPNAVHSMDAALIHLTFAFWEQPFTVIHDCVMGRSCDMTQMASEIRLHFAEMYKADVLADWADQVGVELPPGLVKNTLDIESVNRSLYFFS
jgi:DNA-directed RNA polymerase